MNRTGRRWQMEAQTGLSSLRTRWCSMATRAKMTRRSPPTFGQWSRHTPSPLSRWVNRSPNLIWQPFGNRMWPLMLIATLNFAPQFLENQLWRPDHCIKSDVRSVQVPADGHRQQRPVRLDASHSAGPDTWAVWTWVAVLKENSASNMSGGFLPTKWLNGCSSTLKLRKTWTSQLKTGNGKTWTLKHG